MSSLQVMYDQLKQLNDELEQDTTDCDDHEKPFSTIDDNKVTYFQQLLDVLSDATTSSDASIVEKQRKLDSLLSKTNALYDHKNISIDKTFYDESIFLLSSVTL